MQTVDPNQTLMSISDVLRHAAISKLVLHAWERRYGLSAHQRTATNRRLYTYQQAERLRFLKICCDRGYRIGNIVDLSLEELADLEEKTFARTLLRPAFELLTSMKLVELEAWLMEQAAEQDVKQFIVETVTPLLHEVGMLWSEKKLSIADEHFITACIKRILLAIFDRLVIPKPSPAPWFLATTPEGEAHEIGALCAAILGRYSGWNALYLGPNLPVAEIARIAERYNVRCICISTTTLPEHKFNTFVRDLQRLISPTTQLVIGGASSGKVSTQHDYININDMRDLCTYFCGNMK